MNGIPCRTVFPALALALGAAACNPPAPAVAPGPGPFPIAMGQAVAGTLSEDDPVALDRGAFRTYRFQAGAGQRLIATAESDDFDTYLTVGRVVGGLFDPIRSNDDGGEDTDSRLFFTAPDAGEYLLVVQGFSEGEFGDFTAMLRPAPEPATGAATALTAGQPVSGDLAETDRVDEEDAGFYDVYTFTGRRGQRVTVNMESEEFDTYLSVGRMQSGEWEELESDDDGGDDTNSRLSLVIPEDGEYEIRARSYDNDIGPYSLTFTERTPVVQAPRPVSAGGQVSGELDEDDQVLETDGSFYEIWTYQGRAGEQLTVDMMSEAFDTYVAVGRMVNGEFEELATMDDGGEGTDTHLEMSLPEDGEYVIRANSFSAGSTGPYTLRVTSSRDR